MRLTFAAIALPLLLISCSTKDQWAKENIVQLNVDDQRVERARKAAQDSLLYFVDYFVKYNGQQNYSFALKKVYIDDEDVEHMWATPFSFDSTGFNCILDNEPNTVENFELGDTVKIRFVDIEDFIIVTADTIIIGHYLQKEMENVSP